MTPIFVASTVRRIVAFLIDAAISNIFWAPVTVQVIGSWFKAQEIRVDFRWIILSFLLAFCYRWFFYYFLGGTIGKLLLGLRLVNRNDPEEGLGFLQSLLRVLTEQLSFFFGLAPQALMFLRFDRTHVADWVAETRVVQLFERDSPPQRRPIMAAIFFAYFFVSGFTGVYKFISTSTFESGDWVTFIESV